MNDNPLENKDESLVGIEMAAKEEEETNDRDVDYFDDTVEDKEQNAGWQSRYFGAIQSGSVRGSIFYMASMCFGPASLSFPIALTNVGLILGTFLFLALTLVSYWSLNNLLETARKKKLFNYSQLIQECLGDKMLLLSDINNMIFCFGVLMAYEFTISKFFMEVASVFFEFDINNSNVKLIQMVVCLFLFQIPLCLLKNISTLQYASIVGVFAYLYTIVVVAVQCPSYYQEGIDEGRNLKLVKPVDWSLLDSFSIFLYAYASHNGILAIFSELKRPTLRRSKKVLNRALIFQISVFAIVAYSGFFSLIETTPSIFISRPTLKSMNDKDYFIIIAKILFMISLQCAVAINYNILRGSIKSFVFKGKESSFIWDFTITVLILVSCNLLTYFVDNVVKIVGIMGGLCAVIVCYISPILCYVKSNGFPLCSFRNIMSLFILGVICVLGVMSTVKTVIDII